MYMLRKVKNFNASDGPCVIMSLEESFRAVAWLLDI